MMNAAGARLPPAEKEAIAQYLIDKLPGRPKPRPIILPGAVQVKFREWQVPTPGSRPHDPLATPDGAIWYTGQMANVLGRLDPASGSIKEFPLKTPASGPHGLVNDRDGAIWFTANFAGYVGRLDPETGAITEYRMPDAAARDPHTLLVDKDGVIWFTVQNANMIGRLDPHRSAQGGAAATADIKLAPLPTAQPRPYGMALSSDGATIFVDLFGTNKIAAVDRRTMAIREYVLPDGASRPRGSRSMAMAWSGTAIMRAAAWGASSANRRRDRIFLARRSAGRALRHHGGRQHHLVR